MIREAASLTAVELYKFFITRATFTLTVGSFFVSAAVAILANTTSMRGTDPISIGAALSLATLPVGIFVPIASILIFTSDWQHRDMVTYCSIERRRAMIFSAKLTAAVAVSVLILLLLLVAVVLSASISSALSGSVIDWDAGEPLVTLISAVFVGSLCGAALGALLMSASLAVAASILQTLLVDPLLGFLPHGVGDFFRVGSITGDWAYLKSPWAIVTSALVWIAIPLIVGAVRAQRREP